MMDRSDRASIALCLAVSMIVGMGSARSDDWKSVAQSVTVHRDPFGVPHIHGPTDQSVIFGYGYCQAEDYFWQVEENLLRAAGRAAEANGKISLDSDLLTHNFGIPSQCRARFGELPAIEQMICTAFAEGINFYLQTHPETKPRLLTKVEPWVVYAHRLQVGLDWMFGKAHVSKKENKDYIAASRVASNGWAIAPGRTANGSTMLFINPHQPWFGPGSWYEGHLKSDEGWNFSGASFFANPFPSLGHNEHLGWGHTANNPDVADAYRLTFDDPADKLRYRHGDGYRTARKRTEIVKVKTDGGIEEHTYEFLDTHLGPVVDKEDDTHFVAVRIANLDRLDVFSQSHRMTKAKNWDEWSSALGEMQLSMFNCIYADRAGNIAYIYNGAIPRRDPSFAWDKVVDGTDPKTEWQGYHSLAELPLCVNPPSGYVQNCNQSPFVTTDDGNPIPQNFPNYMVGDRNVETRRAQRSRSILREMKDVTFDQWCAAGVDTKAYWPMIMMPGIEKAFAQLEKEDPTLAQELAPYVEHLLGWDFDADLDSTEATLCLAWYMELYAMGDPGADTSMQPKYMASTKAQLEALKPAVGKLKLLYGDWKVPWGRVARLQRIADVRDQSDLVAQFSKDKPHLPSPGMPGQMGTIFNTYYMLPTPQRREMFGIAGHSYVACIEFGKDRVRARSIVTFGQSGDPKSPHFFDQAELYSKRQYKEAWFDWDDIVKNTKAKYHPGEKVIH
jgi:acyl-homoserine lactone acylase PvdQ